MNLKISAWYIDSSSSSLEYYYRKPSIRLNNLENDYKKNRSHGCRIQKFKEQYCSTRRNSSTNSLKKTSSRASSKRSVLLSGRGYTLPIHPQEFDRYMNELQINKKVKPRIQRDSYRGGRTSRSKTQKNSEIFRKTMNDYKVNNK